MPTSPPSLCTARCGTLVYGGGQCAGCRSIASKATDKKRGNRHARGYNNVWANFSKAYRQENPYCVSERHYGQRVPATDVDHIDGGGPNGTRGYDPTNLAGYCHPCHSSKTARFDGGFGNVQEADAMAWSAKQTCATPTCNNLVSSGWCEDCQRKQMSDTKITVVAGPPGAGKTTYVEKHKGKNDLVIDLDALGIALGSDVTHDHNDRILPFMFAARDAVIARMSRPNDIDRVWVIRCAPTNAERREWWQADVIVIETPADEAWSRAKQAKRPAQWRALINAWWDDYQPNAADTIIRP